MKSFLFFSAVVFVSAVSQKICAQTGLFSFGYSFEQYQDAEPFDLVVSDFNNYYTQPPYFRENVLDAPGLSRGIVLGFKVNNKWSSIGLDMHLHRFIDKGNGVDSAGNEYFRKIKITHDGFSFFYNLNLIHAEGFRAGPGFSFNMDQFYGKVKTYSNPGYRYQSPTDKFLLSGTARFMLSFGKTEGFNFDIIPYYMLPFWKVNISAFNNDLNAEHVISHTKEEMTFDPASMGIMVTLNFNVK
jgi:hypothetical protein